MSTKTVCGGARRRVWCAMIGLAMAVTAALPVRAQWSGPVQVLIDRVAADHDRFAEAAGTLAHAVTLDCRGSGHGWQSPDAFHDAADAFQAVQWAQIGPAVLFDRRYRVNFWPDDNNAVSRQLGAAVSEPDMTLLEPGAIAQASVALQGLPALERLLFGQPHIENGGYRCELAVVIADNVAAIAADTAADWRDIDRMPGMTGADAALDSMMGAILAYLEVVVDRKIARVIGTTPDEARPRRSEAWRSGRSLANIAINLEAIDRLLYGGDDAPLTALLAGAGVPQVADDGQHLMAEAVAQAEEVRDRTMEEVATSEDGHARLLALRAAISDVRHHMGEQIFPALGLTVGFNSMDGD